MFGYIFNSINLMFFDELAYCIYNVDIGFLAKDGVQVYVYSVVGWVWENIDVSLCRYIRQIVGIG